jgi:tetratricopeptide (TPR) repeat protein
MEKDSNTINNSVSSISKTLEHNNNSLLNQTKPDIKTIEQLNREAYTLKKKADNKFNPGCCLDTLCTSKTKRYEHACDLYKRAGDKYKICGQWRKAAECYDCSAKMQTSLNGNPVPYYQESFFCYSKANSTNSSMVFEKMNLTLERQGEYYQAGKNNENLAIKNENEEKYTEAINYYLQAFKYYESDGKHESLKINIEKKIVDLMMIHDHPDAKEKVPVMLEDIGKNYLKKPLTKYSASDYFGKAVLSIICYSNNASEGTIYINKYKEIDNNFQQSTIYDLCCKVSDCMEKKDANRLRSVINEYKEICETDEFMDNILNKLIDKISVNNYNNIYNEEEDLK